MKIAAAYVRVSTDDQLEYSPDSQIKIIREYAKRNDMIIPKEFVFVDEGISGRNAEKRPAFMNMIGTAKKKPKPFDVILVYSYSRFARNREDSVVFKRMLRTDLSVEVISVSQEFGTDKTSILIEALLEAMDEYYSIDLAENVKRGMLEKASRGGVVAAAPFGYVVEKNNYLPHEEKSKIVKMIFDDFVNGAIGCREIAMKLNVMGITTERNNNFENRTIEYILKNPTYIGKIRWNPTQKTSRDFNHKDIIIVDGSHESIISEKLFTSAQEKISKTKNLYLKNAKQKAHNEFMLRGLVRCSECGSTLVYSQQGRLQCHSYSKGACSISHSISISVLSKAVIDVIKLLFKDKNFEINVKTQDTSEGKDIKLLEQAIKREQQKLVRVKEAYENGIDTMEEYRQNKEKIASSIKAFEVKALTEKKQDFKKEFLENHRQTINLLDAQTSTESEKNQLLRSFVEKIVFNRTLNSIDITFYI